MNKLQDKVSPSHFFATDFIHMCCDMIETHTQMPDGIHHMKDILIDSITNCSNAS